MSITALIKLNFFFKGSFSEELSSQLLSLTLQCSYSKLVMIGDHEKQVADGGKDLLSNVNSATATVLFVHVEFLVSL